MAVDSRSEVFARLDRIGRRQYGLVTAAQMRALGIGGDETRWLVRTGRLFPERRGVYRLVGSHVGWHSRVLAAVLAAGPGTVASHSTAAVIWGFAEPHEMEAVETTGSRHSRLVGVRSHRHHLDPVDRGVRALIPVTAVERTLIDLGAAVPAVQVGRWLDEAVRRELTTLERFHAVATRHEMAGRRRLDEIREALADRGIGYAPGANDWERAMDDMWEAMHLPAAERQRRIEVPGGRWFVPDRAIVAARICIDWNGRAWHGTRSGFDSDSRRRGLISQAGWHPLDFTTRSTPEEICRTVLAVYHQRMAWLAPGAGGPGSASLAAS